MYETNYLTRYSRVFEWGKKETVTDAPPPGQANRVIIDKNILQNRC